MKARVMSLVAAGQTRFMVSGSKKPISPPPTPVLELTVVWSPVLVATLMTVLLVSSSIGAIKGLSNDVRRGIT